MYSLNQDCVLHKIFIYNSVSTKGDAIAEIIQRIVTEEMFYCLWRTATINGHYGHCLSAWLLYRCSLRNANACVYSSISSDTVCSTAVWDAHGRCHISFTWIIIFNGFSHKLLTKFYLFGLIFRVLSICF